MKLIADADVWDPVVRALQELRFPIYRLTELAIPIRPDKKVMEGVIANEGILLTADKGIPSQAYLADYLRNEVSIVLLRLSPEDAAAWQRTAEVILQHWRSWERLAQQSAIIVSVTWSRVRVREFSTLFESGN